MLKVMATGLFIALVCMVACPVWAADNESVDRVNPEETATLYKAAITGTGDGEAVYMLELTFSDGGGAVADCTCTGTDEDGNEAEFFSCFIGLITPAEQEMHALPGTWHRYTKVMALADHVRFAGIDCYIYIPDASEVEITLWLVQAEQPDHKLGTLTVAHDVTRSPLDELSLE